MALKRKGSKALRMRPRKHAGPVGPLGGMRKGHSQPAAGGRSSSCAVAPRPAAGRASVLATDTHRLRGENPAPPAPLLRGPPCFPGADAGALPSLSGVGREFPRARRGCRTCPFLLEKVFSPRLWQNSPTEGQVDTRPQVLAALSSVIWREKSNRWHRLCGPSLSRSVYDEVSKMPPRLARRGRHARAAPGGLPSSLTAPVMPSDARRACREVTACSSCWRGWDCRRARRACAARLAGIGELAGPSSQPPQPGSSPHR